MSTYRAKNLQTLTYTEYITTLTGTRLPGRSPSYSGRKRRKGSRAIGRLYIVPTIVLT